MTDYKWGIGTGGEMMIRDTGTYVEFWITSNNSTSYNHDLPWGYTVNGVTDNTNEYDYQQNSGWERLGRWNVTYDQTVTFRLYDTGTGSMGSGETHSVAIERATVPPAPSIVTVTPTNTTIYVNMNSNGNGGATVDIWQLAYSTSSTRPSSPSTINLSLDAGIGTITGLTPGTTYYLWARGHNSKGWGAWSSRASTKTHTVPPAPSSPVLSAITQSSVHAKITSNGDGGKPILEWQIGYGTDPATPTNWVSGSDIDIPNLTPGAKIYFWGRGRNTYGWGAYSARSEATLLAGAYVDVAGVKKRAVPYVKVAGVWKVVEVRINIKGLWTGTG